MSSQKSPLNERRELNCNSLEEIGRRLGTTQGQVSRRQPREAMPRGASAVRHAHALGLSAADLMAAYDAQADGDFVGVLVAIMRDGGHG